MGTPARIDELRKKFDENPRRYFAPLANEYRKAGDLEQAIFICQEYLPQQPGHMSGHIVYGQALYESGRSEEAKAVFETALSLDPENLIALRHLGDIARGAGDPTDARTWYQRVLDADPRNEEIIQLLASVESESAGIPQAPTVEHAPASGMDAIHGALDVEDSSSGSFIQGSEIEKSVEAMPHGYGFDEPEQAAPPADDGELDVPPLPPLPPSYPAPAAATTSDDDLLDLEDFTLGGVASTPAASSAPAEQATTPGLDGDVTISGGFSLGNEVEEEQFQSDPFGMGASAPEPSIEQAADPALSLADESIASDDSAGDAVSLDGLQTFEAGVIAEKPDEVLSLETESFFDLPTAAAPPAAPSLLEEEDGSSNEEPIPDEPISDEPFGDEVMADDLDGGAMSMDEPSIEEPSIEEPSIEVPSVEEPSVEEPQEAFVTETMAELYIQQGHLESALDIYQKLIQQQPDNPELHERLRAIRDRMFGAPAAVGDDADSPPPPSAGPTIREFLMGLVARRPANGGSSNSTSDAVENVEPPHSGIRMTPGASETISGSIDALFSGAHASVSDEAAADALAAAFSDTEQDSASVEPPPLPGTPAHRAPDELSLDHVFKSNSPPRESGGANGFSFDEFFADEMTDPAAESSGDAAPRPAEATDDIEQFNAWLNGLKKT